MGGSLGQGSRAERATVFLAECVYMLQRAEAGDDPRETQAQIRVLRRVFDDPALLLQELAELSGVPVDRLREGGDHIARRDKPCTPG